MHFQELIYQRQSCRNFDPDRQIGEDALEAILEAGRMAPSACNGQPYRFTLCRGEVARQVAAATRGMGMNKFTADAPVMLVISEESYVASAALGAKVKGNDYRSIDIGIAAAYLTAAATEQGVGSCILGWFDDAKIRELCALNKPVRLVIALGYPKENEVLRSKKRKDAADLIGNIE